MTRSSDGPVTRVDVLLGVGYDPDVRLRRETQALAAAGCSIRILAWDRDGTRPALEDDGPVRVQRVTVRSRWGRGWTQLVALPRVFVRYLRKKLEKNPARPTFIVTDSGVGYRFCPEPDDSAA